VTDPNDCNCEQSRRLQAELARLRAPSTPASEACDIVALHKFVRDTGSYRLVIDVRADGRVDARIEDTLYTVAHVDADAHEDCYRPIDWRKLKAACAGRVRK
jgi:hypothetical protein